MTLDELPVRDALGFLARDALASRSSGCRCCWSLAALAALGALWVCGLASAAASGSIELAGRDAPWSSGSADCAARPGPALEAHRYDERTIILREGLCTTFEAPFMYLLIGGSRALLIDSGDVADPGKVPLAQTVLDLLPGDGAQKLPLLVVHTHRHLDHRAGDAQLAGLAHTQVAGFDLDSVKQLYQLPHWPEGSAQLDLGGRIVEVIPTPGHNETEVSFYDRSSGLVLSGDFLLPARILVDDADAYRRSVARLMQALRGRPVTAFLGGHIEMDAHGTLYGWQATYHPDEAALAMAPAQLAALGEALTRFNGFYTHSVTHSGGFTMENSIHILEAFAAATVLLVAALIWGGVRLLRRRRALPHAAASAAAAGGG